MTWAEAKTIIRGLFVDRARTWIQDGQLDIWARDVINRAAETTRYLHREDDDATGDPFHRIDMPEDLIRVLRVETDNHGMMRHVTTQEIAKNDRHWQNDTGTPRFYYADTMSGQAGGEYVGLYPRPASATDYRMQYEAYPAAPSTASDTNALEIPDWCSGLVVYGVLEKCYEADTPKRNHRLALFYRRLYDTLVYRLQVRSHGRDQVDWIPGRPARRALDIEVNFPDNIPAP